MAREGYLKGILSSIDRFSKTVRNSTAAVLVLTAAGSVSAQTTVTWETLGNFSDGAKPYRVERFTVVPDRELKSILFNNISMGKAIPANPLDTLIEIIPRYYELRSPRLSKVGEKLEIDLKIDGILTSVSRIPSGMHALDRNGKVVQVKAEMLPMTVHPGQWSLGTRSVMPKGSDIYARNEKLADGKKPGVYDIVPSFKSVKPGDATTKVTKERKKKIRHANPEYCRITVKNGEVLYEYASEPGYRQASRAFREKVLAPAGYTVPEAVIEDWPDFNTRGVMIDVSRNFLPMENLRKYVSELALSRFNTLQLHFIDDEGWRIEIPSLPELTEFGSRRGYSPGDRDFLNQVYSGNGDPSDRMTTANGYYTRSEFIDFLKFCDGLGVTVIPEIEAPGHARAAAYAMEYRARKTGDDSYLLREPSDTSRYDSASEFHDNVMNPALPGTYKFMKAVINDILKMYKEAGVKIDNVHIGGDEVPEGAWSGSAAMARFMRENNLKTQGEVHALFVERLSDFLSSKGLKMSGWQEVAIDHSDSFNAKVAPRTGYVNAWSTLGERSRKSLAKALKDGFPIMLSNVSSYYLDMSSSGHPMERGLRWGGYVDELKTFTSYPDSLLEVAPDAKGKIVGVMGHLWAETLIDPDYYELQLFPKALGVAERGWNSKPTYTEADYLAAVSGADRRRWEKAGLRYHILQPGVRVDEKGMVSMNSPYGNDFTIRYTTDGSEPTASSAEYKSPFPKKDARQIRARIFGPNGESSVTTIEF